MSNILFYDIETSPNIGLFWKSSYKVNIPYTNIIDERKIVCICWKWQGEKEVHSLQWNRSRDDKAMLRKFSKILNKADLVVGHNADNYDYKFINGRLAYHDLPPLSKQASVDTLKHSRKAFNINSHRLDYLGKFLNLGGKDGSVSFALWKKVLLHNDEASMKRMVRYCKRDVVLLEKVYNKILPYAPNSIHQGVLKSDDRLACKSCGSTKTHFYGNRIARLVKYKARRCTDCGHCWRTEIRSDSV